MPEIEKKSLKEYQTFITTDGVMESEGIDVFKAGFPDTAVESIHFLYAPREIINKEFPVENYGHGQYMLEIKLAGHVPMHVRNQVATSLKNPVEYKNHHDYYTKNEVNVYVPDDESGASEEPTVVLIAMGNPDKVMEFLESGSIALDKAASNAVKILHEDVWPTFQAKFKK